MKTVPIVSALVFAGCGLAGCGGADYSWLAAVPRDEFTVRVVVSGSATVRIEDAEVRDDSDEVGISLEVEESSGDQIMIVGMACADIALPSPLDGRPVVDDDGGDSVVGGDPEAARRFARDQSTRCTPIDG